MLEKLRPSFVWCQLGTVCGAAVTVAWSVMQDGGMGVVVLAGVVGAVVGCACGFTGATFYYGIKRLGLRRVLRGTLEYSLLSAFLAPLLHFAGWSTQAGLAAEMGVGALFLGIAGGYCASIEVWLPREAG